MVGLFEHEGCVLRMPDWLVRFFAFLLKGIDLVDEADTALMDALKELDNINLGVDRGFLSDENFEKIKVFLLSLGEKLERYGYESIAVESGEVGYIFLSATSLNDNELLPWIPPGDIFSDTPLGEKFFKVLQAFFSYRNNIDGFTIKKVAISYKV